jgi:hypothetical protein
LEYIVVKCADYRMGVGRGSWLRMQGEAVRQGGNCKTKLEIAKLDEEREPLSRQMRGFLALGPSRELARVELTKSN